MGFGSGSSLMLAKENRKGSLKVTVIQAEWLVEVLLKGGIPHDIDEHISLSVINISLIAMN